MPRRLCSGCAQVMDFCHADLKCLKCTKCCDCDGAPEMISVNSRRYAMLERQLVRDFARDYKAKLKIEGGQA